MKDSESPFKDEEEDGANTEEHLPKSLRNLKEDAPKNMDRDKLGKIKQDKPKSWGASIDEYFGNMFGSSKNKVDSEKPTVIEEGNE